MNKVDQNNCAEPVSPRPVDHANKYVMVDVFLAVTEMDPGSGGDLC